LFVSIEQLQADAGVEQPFQGVGVRLQLVGQGLQRLGSAA